MKTVNPAIYLSLFDEIKSMASPNIWNKAVGLARTSSVTLLKIESDEEITVRVELPSAATAVQVRLSPLQQLWECDSLSDDDPSLYVLITVIAVRNNYLKAETARWKIGYFFRKDGDSLIIDRAFIHPDFPKRVIGILETEMYKNPDYLVSRNDITLDRIIDFGKKIDAQLFCNTIPYLAESTDLFMDDRQVTLQSSPIEVGIVIEDHPKGYRIGQLLPLSASQAQYITPYLYQSGASLIGIKSDRLPAMIRGNGTIMGHHQAELLFNTMLPKLKDHFDVSINVSKIPKFLAAKPRLLVVADKRGSDGVWLSPHIVYGDPIVAEIKNNELSYKSSGYMIHRDIATEQRILGSLPLQLRGANSSAREFQGAEAVALIKLTKEHIADSRSIAHLIPKESLEPRFSEDLNQATLYFTGKIDTKESTVSSTAVWNAYSDGYGVIKLKDGSWANLPGEWLNTIAARGADLLEALLCKSVTPSIATRLAPIIGGESTVQFPAQWKQFLNFLDGTLKVPACSLSDSVSAIVRPYQREGIQWAHTLRTLQVGGLMADDMGLGKTLQTLCVLPPKTLIIAPTSVLGSWLEQCKRFRPDFKVCLYHGTQRVFDEQADAYITSFTLVRSDQNILERQWNAIVIDEAHTLKNPLSLTFAAVQSLNSKWRIALTGTPIENSLQDLWAQFSLLNPGLLPPYDTFREWPLEKIRSLTRPFILRRTKEEVAKDLPPKTEIILKCTLSDDERTTYDAILLATQRDLTTEDGVKLSALQILEALLRLRQACCHPGLIAENYLQKSSAKLDLLMESLTASLDSNHPALIFSQWVGLLNIVEARLIAQGISFTRLDGSTKDRQSIVNEFQSPDGPMVMLISLKAGGVGLTLTRAEHVYLLDPWWNPAVEEQAAARAHRIGQTNPVFVYKLIAENTIEEQVLEMQERKLALANQILASDVEGENGDNNFTQAKWSLNEMKSLLGL